MRRFRRKSFRRARSRRWDMQTYRECERDLQMVGETACDDAPQIFLDYVLGAGSTSGQLDVPALGRALMFGGGHLQVDYNAAVVSHDDLPCHPSVAVVTALIKLPLLEDEIVPAYVPNLAVNRNQLAVIRSQQPDADEDILFWRREQLDLANLVCGGANSAACWPNSDVLCRDGSALETVLGTAAAQYGRASIREVIRTRRRLKEREAIFLYTHLIQPLEHTSGVTWPIRRNVYFRFAAAASR